jgi:hypothetical protein
VTPDEGFTLTQVQQYAPDPATGSRRLVRERHYVRLRPAPHAPPVYVQSGQCWSERGDVIDPIPDGVLVQLQMIAPSVRAACGWPGDPPMITILNDVDRDRTDQEEPPLAMATDPSRPEPVTALLGGAVGPWVPPEETEATASHLCPVCGAVPLRGAETACSARCRQRRSRAARRQHPSLIPEAPRDDGHLAAPGPVVPIPVGHE